MTVEYSHVVAGGTVYRRTLVILAVLCGAGTVSAHAQVQPLQRATRPAVLDSRAVRAAVTAHARALAQVDTAQGGLWIVEDHHGRLVSSGVVANLTNTISSDNIAAAIPGAAGQYVTQFGFVLTPLVNGHHYRVAHAVVGVRT